MNGGGGGGGSFILSFSSTVVVTFGLDFALKLNTKDRQACIHERFDEVVVIAVS